MSTEVTKRTAGVWNKYVRAHCQNKIDHMGRENNEQVFWREYVNRIPKFINRE